MHFCKICTKFFFLCLNFSFLFLINFRTSSWRHPKVWHFKKKLCVTWRLLDIKWQILSEFFCHLILNNNILKFEHGVIRSNMQALWNILMPKCDHWSICSNYTQTLKLPSFQGLWKVSSAPKITTAEKNCIKDNHFFERQTSLWWNLVALAILMGRWCSWRFKA